MTAAAPGEHWTWMVQDAGVSASGDLGYAYGAWRSVRPGTDPASGFFLRIWSRPPGTEWKVVLDLADSTPPPKP